MKAYVLTSGIIFVLVLTAHVARVFAEGARLLKEPSFVFTTILSVLLAAWAWRVFRKTCQLEKRSKP